MSSYMYGQDSVVQAAQSYRLYKKCMFLSNVETWATFTSPVAYGYTNTCSSELDVGISTNCTGEDGPSPPFSSRGILPVFTYP